MRARDPHLERYLTTISARAAGLPHDGGLGQFADERAMPGGVRDDIDAAREMSEELADARNYAVWGIEPIYAQVVAGDLDSMARYDRLLRGLVGVQIAWNGLYG